MEEEFVRRRAWFTRERFPVLDGGKSRVAVRHGKFRNHFNACPFHPFIYSAAAMCCWPCFTMILLCVCRADGLRRLAVRARLLLRSPRSAPCSLFAIA